MSDPNDKAVEGGGAGPRPKFRRMRMMKYPSELVEAVEAALHYGDLFESPSLITSIDVLDALVAALPAAGCKIIVAESAPGMLAAADNEVPLLNDLAFRRIYRAMFDAASTVPEAWQENATLPPPPPR